MNWRPIETAPPCTVCSGKGRVLADETVTFVNPDCVHVLIMERRRVICPLCDGSGKEHTSNAEHVGRGIPRTDDALVGNSNLSGGNG